MLDTTDCRVRVDVAFRLAGTRVPTDHGYALYSALCHELGDLHGATWLAVHPLTGIALPNGELALRPNHGSLRLRVEAESIHRVISLGGKQLEIAGHPVYVGVSSIYPLQPARTLRARNAVIKGYMEPEPFRQAVAQKLLELEVTARIEIGRRRVVQIAEHKVVGFEVSLHEVSEQDSLKIQYAGIGGRQRMGCGVFIGVGGRA